MTKKNGIFCAVSCISALVAASGCGMIKNMDEMHKDTHDMSSTTEGMAKTTQDMKDTTQGMAKTTDGMAKTTEDMKKTTEHMAKTTDGLACTAKETYDGIKQGNTLVSRDGENVRKQMDEAGPIETKIFYAGAYMKAFEFQIWNCSDTDSHKYLQSFYMQAAEEFVRVLPSYLSTDPSTWSISPTSNGNNANNLYAMAVTLQELNANVVVAYKMGKWEEKDKPQSLLDLIQSSLSRKIYLAAHPSEASLMDHQFLANEHFLKQLLQVRMNFLAAMALVKVSDLETKGRWGLHKLFSGLKKLLGGWTPNLRMLGDQRDYERVMEYTRYLYGSNDARSFLFSIGEQPLLDSQIYKMYSHMRTGYSVQPRIPNPKNDADLAFNNTQDAIQMFLDQLDVYFGRKAFQKIPYLDHPEFYNY